MRVETYPNEGGVRVVLEEGEGVYLGDCGAYAPAGARELLAEAGTTKRNASIVMTEAQAEELLRRLGAWRSGS